MRNIFVIAAMACLSACGSSFGEPTPMETNLEMTDWISDHSKPLDVHPKSIYGIPVIYNSEQKSYDFDLPAKGQKERKDSQGSIYFIDPDSIDEGLSERWTRKIQESAPLFINGDISSDEQEIDIDASLLGQPKLIIQATDMKCPANTTCKLINDIFIAFGYQTSLDGNETNKIIWLESMNILSAKNIFMRYGISSSDICGFNPYSEPLPLFVADACIGRMQKVLAREKQFYATLMTPNSTEALKSYTLTMLEQGEIKLYSSDKDSNELRASMGDLFNMGKGK